MRDAPSAIQEVKPAELGDALSAVRLCSPQARQQMQLSFSRFGQLTPIQLFRSEKGLELIDGFKRVRAACQLSWPTLRAEVQPLDWVGAKLRLWLCNAGAGLSVLEEAWLIRSLYREDKLTQPQIAMLLGRHKSWVCRRLTLAEGLSDELTAKVRLGLLCARAASEVGRLPRGNQDAVARIVMARGMTTGQTARLVDALLATPATEWNEVLPQTAPPPPQKGGDARRTPGEQLVADAWSMKRIGTRLHARLLERSLESLGADACALVARELRQLQGMLRALSATLEQRLTPGAANAA